MGAVDGRSGRGGILMRDEWALVKSEDELRPGMCVKILSYFGRAPMVTTLQGRSDCKHRTGGTWRHFSLDRPEECCADLHRAIQDKALFRLVIDDDTAADETATTIRRNREVAR